ncbi:hypothetical protein BDP81DRAFT_445999 [Colletotrichum phormii]|uniref:Uncharacterized protein n=1 Tax=Colletotrichum phormii TaxID=359342 RepID=A0AAI9ZZF6_9PEZI|nr:uncharacterized protein BDP81DRAFT_445999 [Colletotrichum phormii]KAK1641023.1 hypothetical protein BDP81DRAFT_445999 [Colletotrichum phormii]
MKFSTVAVLFLSSVVTALPQPLAGKEAISDLQARVASNNPGGDVGGAILVDRDLEQDDDEGQEINTLDTREPKQGGNGGGGGSSLIEQLQSTFDRNNPNGTPTAPGDPADLNGDGVINVFEAGAQAS